MKGKQSCDENTSSFFTNFKISGCNAINTITLWQASLSKTSVPQIRLFQEKMKHRRQYGETYIVRKVSRICFWLHEHLVQPESWTLPFCLQVILVIVSWSSSTPSAVTSANDSQIFLMIKFLKGEDHYSEFLIAQGFPLLFASLTCRQEQFITVLGASWCSQSVFDLGTAYSGIS